MTSDAGDGAQEPIRWSLPLADGSFIDLDVSPSRFTVFVGPNGSGKSALAHRIEQLVRGQGRVHVNRVIAHRQVWLSGAGPNITPSTRSEFATNIILWNGADDSRWRDHVGAKRPALSIFDLLEQTNRYNQLAIAAIGNGEDPKAVLAPEFPSPLQVVNRVLQTAGFAFQVDLDGGGGLQAEASGEIYPINYLSDGEKNALVLAAEVVTAEPNTLHIIDEPERHLHRSLSADLILMLAAVQPASHFVLLTHDLDLAERIPSSISTKVVLTGCTWVAAKAVAWSAHLLEPTAAIGENARRAVLGGRKAVRFVEGAETSLDAELYRILLPHTTVRPIGGGDDVIRATKGLRSADSLHWVDARGIVDRDRRDQAEILALRDAGVDVLEVSEVENIYYWPEVIRAVASAVAQTHEKSGNELADLAISSAFASLTNLGVQEHIAAQAAMAEVRRNLLASAPSEVDVKAWANLTPVIPIPYASERATIQNLVATQDLAGFLQQYPIRDSAAPDRVAKSLELANTSRYEAAVRSELRQNSALREVVLRLVIP